MQCPSVLKKNKVDHVYVYEVDHDVNRIDKIHINIEKKTLIIFVKLFAVDNFRILHQGKSYLGKVKK